MQIQTKKFAGLTGNQLKLLALIAMTCDHVGLQLLPQFIILRIIGRLAAPLFAYMIAEGCRYTHNRGRYLGRLLGMAALCQIAYFAAMRSLYQCIFVTLSLSVCLIYALDNAVRRRTPVSVLSAAAAVAAVVFVTEGLPRILIHTDFDVDYGLWGVMLPVLVYFGRGKWGKLALFAVGVGLLGLHYGGTQWWGLLSVPLLAYQYRRINPYWLNVIVAFCNMSFQLGINPDCTVLLCFLFLQGKLIHIQNIFPT